MPFASPLKFNSVVPSFKLLDENGECFNLASHSANHRNVVLFFYPKHLGESEKMDFYYLKEAFENFEELNAVVACITPSSIFENASFKKKFGLPFSILSDESGNIRGKYGYKYFVVSTRLTVVIDRHQKLVHQYESLVSSKNHTRKSLKILRDISSYRHSYIFNHA